MTISDCVQESTLLTITDSFVPLHRHKTVALAMLMPRKLYFKGQECQMSCPVKTIFEKSC